MLTGVRANQLAGAGREALARAELEAKFPGASIQNEAYLRGANGKRAIDPLTGTARRIDSVVIQDGRVLDSVEVTSMTASKDAQVLKELRIRNNGGTYIGLARIQPSGPSSGAAAAHFISAIFGTAPQAGPPRRIDRKPARRPSNSAAERPCPRCEQ